MVATTDALTTSDMGNKIQLSTYKKWTDDNNGITLPKTPPLHYQIGLRFT